MAKRFDGYRVVRIFQTMRSRLAGWLWLSDLPAMLCWAVLAGVLGAGATIAFHEGMGLVQRLVTGSSGSIIAVTQGLPWYGRLLFPALGALAAGCLLWLASKVQGGDHSDYMESVAIGDGRLSIRRGVLRSLSSLLSVASGGSLGREGAMVHLGALGASAIGRFTSFGTARLRLLVACGAAAGVAAAYGAPLAAAVFVAEIVLGAMTMQSFGPLLVAAASANIVMRVSGHYQTTYAMTAMPPLSGPEVLPFILLGVVAGLAAPLFLKFLGLCRQQFQRTGLPLPLRLALGGLLLGLILIAMPEVAGNGYSVVHSLLHVSWAWYAVVLILALKVLATGLTVGSGAVGGVFTPALFVGAALGTLFGQLFALVWPGIAAPVYFFTLVGMGSFLGAATSAPFMAILMIFEMTLSYQVVLPLILAVVVAYFVARAMAEVAMYDITATRERDARMRRQLRQTLLSQLIKPATTVVQATAPVAEVVQMFMDYPVKYLYVVDQENTFLGVIAQHSLSRLLWDQADASSKTAADVLQLDAIKTLHPDMTLDQAQDYFVQFPGERLPVVTRDGPPHLLGVVYKSSLLEKYSALKKAMDASDALIFDFPPGRRS